MNPWNNLGNFAAAALCALTVVAGVSAGAAAQASPEGDLHAKNIDVYKEAGVYACFPSLLQMPDGTLYTAFSTRRNTKKNNPHADATGGSAVCVSHDGGKTWKRFDGPMPDDPANRTQDGGSVHASGDGWVETPAEKRDEYKKQGYVTIGVRPGVAAYLGGARIYTRRPGETTETSRPVPGTEQANLMVYGESIRTRTGVRLTPIYGSLRRPPVNWTTTYVIRSDDDGATWQMVPIATPIHDAEGKRIAFDETGLTEFPDGRIIAMMRPSPDSFGYLYESVSSDAGKTWSAPARTPMWGFPAHLLVLRNGDLLCTYGYRRAPMGIRACISHDGGATWDIANEYVLRDDGMGRGMDLGYPRTKQNKDGTLVTVYYMTTADGVTHVAATRWRVPKLSGTTKGVPVTENASQAATPIVISHGAAAGTYQAFPDMCRLKDGTIAAVFYAGYQHVSKPRQPDWPNGGRICMVESKDEGHTWSEPRVIFDDPADDRDPHIAQMPDGSLWLSFFSPGVGVEVTTSHDGGKTWDAKGRPLTHPGSGWYCSAPVRALPSGTWILGAYKYVPSENEIYGGALRSTDQGKTWSDPIPIGNGQGLALDAETDIISLKDGALFAALRCGQPGKDMYGATSTDDGRTWSPARDLGFHGESPYIYRLTDGAILMAVRRRPDTVLYISRDETKSWQGPYQIDDVLGGYPSITQLKDGTVLIIYYTEGKDSVIRARRFRVGADGIEALPL